MREEEIPPPRMLSPIRLPTIERALLHAVRHAFGLGAGRGEAFLDTHLNDTNTLSGQGGTIDEITHGECLAPTPGNLRARSNTPWGPS